MATSGMRPAGVSFPSLAKKPSKASSDKAVLESAKRHLIDYKALVERAADVFGSELIASRWLSTPSPDFDGHTPIHAAMEHNYDPEYVERVFEPIFTVIEHGIYT